MSKKPSLGHNPLAYSLKNHASFDFIKSTREQQKPEEAKAATAQKKVASYYLEETVIEKIRIIAEEQEKSFSCLVNEILKSSIKQEEASE